MAARGQRHLTDETINFDKADASTVYVEASQFVQLFQSGSQKFLEELQIPTIVRSGLADRELKIEIKVSGIDDIVSQLTLKTQKQK